MPKVLAICLDGYEESLGRQFMEAGRMPRLARLRERSCRFFLEHGPDLRTGLAGEHFATGLSPEWAHRWAAVHFDRASYAVWQEGTALTPFPARLDVRTVVVDPPYFDLERAPTVQGIVNWGAHDPGVDTCSRPASLLDEVRARFGLYPAAEWIYGTPWNSEARCREMGECLAKSVRARAELATWLLGDRLPDWDLGIVTVSEAHSAIEGLWHGIDASHRLHAAPSSGVAGAGIRDVYAAIDALVGRLDDAFPDATKVVFAMHGMGANNSDIASMLLLPELMYRHAFSGSYFRREGRPRDDFGGCPAMDEDETWDSWVRAGVDDTPVTERHSVLRSFGAKVLPRSVKRLLKPVLGLPPAPTRGLRRLSLDWMPAARYQKFWHRMPAFALPSFYDGRLRINLMGRERKGVVEPQAYRRTCDALVELLRSCADPTTGEGVIAEVSFTHRTDPADLGPTEADIVVLWHGAPLGFVHPQLGRIGPVPYRRTGGHTGKQGFAYVETSTAAAGDYGLRSAYDVVPTLIRLLGEPPRGDLAGMSLLPERPSTVACA